MTSAPLLRGLMHAYIRFVDNSMRNSRQVSRSRCKPRRGRKRPAGRQLMTLPEQIAEHIFTAIASGEYAPGERVREEALAEQFEVSRGPVREALRIWRRTRSCASCRIAGAHVTQLSVREVDDIFEIRRILSGRDDRPAHGRRGGAAAAAMEADVQSLETLAPEPNAGAAYFEATFRLSRFLPRPAATNAWRRSWAAWPPDAALHPARPGDAGPAQGVGTQLARPAKGHEGGQHRGRCGGGEKLIEESRREAVRQLEARQAGANPRGGG